MPKVSVIVPVYNVEKYLSRSLDCLINQTLKDIEIILINDCSTDNSLEILKEYASKDDRIKLINLETNQGAAVARNRGLDIATGEYLGFVDPDDAIDLNYYEELYKKAKLEDADIVKCIRKEISLENNIIIRGLNQEIEQKGLIAFDYEWQSAIYKASLVYENNIRFPDDLRKAQDVVFLSRITLKAKNIFLIDNVFYYYYKRNDSLDAAIIPKKNILSALTAIKYILNDINDANLPLKDYIYVYSRRLVVMIAYTFFQNPEYDIKLECVKSYIEYFYKCKNIEKLKECVRRDYGWLLPYIEQKDAKKMTKQLMKCKNKYIYNKPLSLGERIFSVKNDNDRDKKIVRILGIKISFKKTNYLYTRIIANHKLSKVKYVHFMHNDKFTKSFVDFLNRNFNPNEHLILCRERFHGAVFPFPKAKNVVKVKNYDGLNFDRKNIKKLIAHSLFDGYLVTMFYENPKLLKKGCWMIYGGDLYWARRDVKNDFVRKNIACYITDSDGDSEVAKEKYCSNHTCYNAGYTFPITTEMLEKTRKEPHDYTLIQINNSADDSTLEMLDILSKYKDENIKIRTILSYGKMEYKDEIIEKGTQIFGEKFEYLDELLPFEKYANYLAQNDILILNQNRQQGMGNTFATLRLGAKVFIRSDVTTYSHLEDKGIKLFDTKSIKDLSFDELKQYTEETKENNIENSKKFFDDSYLKELWLPVFENKRIK